MGPVVLVLNMSGHERTTMWVVLVSAVINAIFNIALIPRFGAMGAAAATTITIIGIQFLLAFLVSRKLSIRCDIAAELVGT